MNKKLFIFLFFVNLMVAQTPVQELFVKWGNDASVNISYRVEPDCYFGPQSFHVQDSIITILDPINNSIKKFKFNHLENQYYSPDRARDFVSISDNSFVFLIGNEVHKYTKHKVVKKYRNKDKFALIKKIEYSGKEVQIENISGDRGLLRDGKIVPHSKHDSISNDQIKVISLTKRTAEILLEKGVNSHIINVNHNDNNLGCMQIIGTDKYDRLYLDVDLIVNEIPLKVERQIWIVNYSGEKLGKINIPTHYYTSINKDLVFNKSGIIHHMISSSDGIYIFKWEIEENIKENFNGVYPEKFLEHLHYNEFINNEEKFEIETGLHKTVITVSREKALEIGDTYVKHQWTCTSANVTDGVETAPDGDKVETPDWINIGTNHKIPYKWGGFNTLPEYDAGMSSEKYAGDIHTDNESSYARGVDCSGFVCRCWQMNSHYSTRMMDNANYGPITLPVSSWSEIKPGDAIHKHGHVRLAVKRNSNGTISAVEAAGSSTDWRVDYTVYTLSQLSSYSPRYYINIEDADNPPESPVLSSVISNGLANLEWSLPDISNCDGTAIEHLNEEGVWEKIFPDSLISIDSTSWKVEWQLNHSYPDYFRLLTVNDGDPLVESQPTDIYGCQTLQGAHYGILIVDGFDRTESSGSYHLPYHEFAKWMGDAIFMAGYQFDTAANEAVAEQQVILNNYDLVFWICGDESTNDESLSSTEQNLLKNYLNNGGQLFISGSEIGWDLDEKGTTSDKSFYNDYLKAEYVADDSKIYNVSGNTGSIFQGMDFTFDNGSHGIYTEDYPDAIKPKNGSSVCLNYSSSYNAGIQYEGLFDGTETGRLVYLAFPWETIVENDKKNELISRVFDFFEITNTDIVSENNYPKKMQLSKGFPNPFNNSVNFELFLPQNAKMSIFVYNHLGEKVRTIKSGSVTGRYNKLIGDGKNDRGQVVASGIYYFSVSWKNQKTTRSVVFLK